MILSFNVPSIEMSKFGEYLGICIGWVTRIVSSFKHLYNNSGRIFHWKAILTDCHSI